MTLRQTVLRGGTYLGVRQVVGLALSLATTAVVIRLIGPRAYGLFAGSLGILVFIQAISQLNISVYVVRSPNHSHDHQAATLILGSSTLSALICLLGVQVGGQIWLPGEATSVFSVLLLGLPLSAAYQIPQARVERDLGFTTVARIELLGQSVSAATSITSAVLGLGSWSPVLGWLAMQSTTAIAYLWRSPLLPRAIWDRRHVREILTYGFSYSGSLWIWNARTLINPIVVGYTLGAEAVGYTALCLRIVDALTFIRTASWRLSIAALARINDAPAKLRAIVEEGAILQLFAVAPALLAFSVLGPAVVSAVFGRRWDGVMLLYPYFAVAAMTNACFSLQSSALYVLRRNWDVAVFHAFYLAAFALGAIGFITLGFGIRSIGLAEFIALPTYIVLARAGHASFGRTIAPPLALWWLASCAALFWRELGWPFLLSPIVPLLVPSTRFSLVSTVRALLAARHDR